MKKALVFIVIFSLVLPILVGCSAINTSGWQTIEIPNCGTLQLPADWSYYEKDGLVYILDHAQNPVMIQTKSYPDVDGRIPGATESNDFFTEVTNLQILTSAVFSNGAIYGTYLTEHNGNQSEKLFLSIGYIRTIDLLVWDETMDEEMLKTIANTFVSAD